MTVDDAATRKSNKQTLRRLMSGIAALDTDAIGAELHDSAVFELPFDSTLPDCDRDGLLQLLSTMFTMFKKFELTITDVYDLVDPDLLIARYSGDCEGRDQPVVYQNEYIGIFRFTDKKIAFWREYANPEIAHAAFAQFTTDAPTINE